MIKKFSFIIKQKHFVVNFSGRQIDEKYLWGFKRHTRNALCNYSTLCEMLDENLPEYNEFTFLIRRADDYSGLYHQKKIFISYSTFTENSIFTEKVIFHELVHYLEDDRFFRNIPTNSYLLTEGIAEYFVFMFYNDTDLMVEKLIRRRFSKNSKHYAAGFFIFGYLYENDRKSFELCMRKNPSKKATSRLIKIINKLHLLEPVWLQILLSENFDFILNNQDRTHGFIFRKKIMYKPFVVTLETLKNGKKDNIFDKIPVLEDKSPERFNYFKPNSCAYLISRFYRPLARHYASLRHHNIDVDKMINKELIIPPFHSVDNINC